MKNREYGPTQVIYGKNGLAVKDGPIKSGSTLRGPENAGVMMRGIYMDAAGDNKPRTKVAEQTLEMNIPSVLL